MALTKVRGGGVDNPLTLGGGAASDRSIIFDGNAQDFHIGLDDSEDKLTIGLGSTLGTTSHMVFDATGAITKPLQPAFLAFASSMQSDLGVAGSRKDINFGTEIYDQNGDFASNTFTAPVTGKYQLNANIRLNNLDTASTYYIIYLNTSNKKYFSIVASDAFSSDVGFHSFNVAVLADMDANDTAIVQFLQQGGTAQTDVDGGASDSATNISGYLVC